MSNETVIIIKTERSMGISIILTLLFGPIGLFYASILGGFLMCILSLVVSFVTLGIGLPVTWFMSMLWGMFSVSTYNQQLRINAERSNKKAA